MRYRRSQAKGASFFFTVNLADRSTTMLVDHINDLRNIMRRVRASHPFEIVAIVALPEGIRAGPWISGFDVALTSRIVVIIYGIHD
jgi:putative transposase